MKWIALLFVASALVTFTSCNKEEDSSLSSVKTNFQVSIPFSTEGLKSQGNNLELVYPFSGENVFTPNSMTTGLESSGPRKIKPLNGAILSIPGIQNGEAITALTLEWSYKTNESDFLGQNSINLLALEHNLNNGILEIKLNDSLVPLIETMDSNFDNSFRIAIKGNSISSLAGMASLEMPVMIESNFTTPRFELW